MQVTINDEEYIRRTDVPALSKLEAENILLTQCLLETSAVMRANFLKPWHIDQLIDSIYTGKRLERIKLLLKEAREKFETEINEPE